MHLKCYNTDTERWYSARIQRSPPLAGRDSFTACIARLGRYPGEPSFRRYSRPPVTSGLRVSANIRRGDKDVRDGIANFGGRRKRSNGAIFGRRKRRRSDDAISSIGRFSGVFIGAIFFLAPSRCGIIVAAAGL